MVKPLTMISIDDVDMEDASCSVEGWCAGTPASSGGVRLDEPGAVAVAAKFAALADPTRLRIISMLSTVDEICSCDLEEPLGKSQPTISHHTRLLAEAGLVEGRRSGRWMWWSLRSEVVAELSGLLNQLTSIEHLG